MSEAGTGSTAWRIARICLVALLWGVGSYLLLEWARPAEGLVSVSFAVVQPAAINAFIACLADPHARRPLSFYLLVPVMSAMGMIVVAAFVLREGVICIAMLAPLWIVFGMAGTGAAYKLREANRRLDEGDTFRVHALIVLPFLVMPLEAQLPLPQDHYTVTRAVVIDAPAEAIWPLMQGMGEVRTDEGQWNVSQSLLGLPRPQSASLLGEGLGATRHARWQRGVAFDEVVTDWQPSRRIGWRFDFTGSQGWEITDPHLRPDGPHMVIESGGYELVPLADGRNLLRLHTSYTAHSHFNGYASLWGELFLGDVQANVLEIIRQRAEGHPAR
ncbi:MAG: SRPBCC family protein [Erythrobacter sp.]|nr:SRPBCC family protein [Erythrobacter sp.]